MAIDRIDQSSGETLSQPDEIDLSAPHIAYIASPNDMLRRQEKERRKPLVRLISVCILIIAVLLVPAGLIPAPDPVTLIGVGVGLVGGLVAYILNQTDHVVGSGIVLLGSVALAIAWEILGKAQVQGGFDLADLRLFDLFAVLIVLSGVLVGRRGALITGLATIGFTLLALLLLPHTMPLQQYWNGTYSFAIHGSSYDVVMLAISIQFLAGSILSTPSSSGGSTQDSGSLPPWRSPDRLDHEFDWPAWLRNQGEEGDMKSPPD